MKDRKKFEKSKRPPRNKAAKTNKKGRPWGKGSLENLEPKLPAMEPVSLIDSNFARSLSRSCAHNQMGHK